jgi:hypothetical protein
MLTLVMKPPAATQDVTNHGLLESYGIVGLTPLISKYLPTKKSVSGIVAEVGVIVITFVTPGFTGTILDIAKLTVVGYAVENTSVSNNVQFGGYTPSLIVSAFLVYGPGRVAPVKNVAGNTPVGLLAGTLTALIPSKFCPLLVGPLSR